MKETITTRTNGEKRILTYWIREQYFRIVAIGRKYIVLKDNLELQLEILIKKYRKR